MATRNTYNCFEFNDQGITEKADCVAPTGQNHANIFHDIEELAEQCATQETKDDAIELLAAMLIRAYDSCISCSVH